MNLNFAHFNIFKYSTFSVNIINSDMESSNSSAGTRSQSDETDTQYCYSRQLSQPKAKTWAPETFVNICIAMNNKSIIIGNRNGRYSLFKPWILS